MGDETYLQQNAIDDHELDLTLGLPVRPLNSYLPCEARYPENVVETTYGQIKGNREQQEIRRQEGRVKRELKRKAGLCFNPQNGVVIEEDREEICEKVVRLGFQWLGGNAGGFQAYQEYNGHSGRKSDGENRASVSSGANSSGVSDYNHSNSAAGVNSSDSSSHSSEPHMHFTAADTKQTASSEQKQTPLNSRRCSKFPEPNPSPKEGRVVIGQPPKANGQKTNLERGLAAQMPCVTTTGNGPEGKTINGFLYKYTKKEVSIVCVCHGASFSPAGFVKHAGGVNVEHPLKHIRISPFPVANPLTQIFS